MRNDSSKFRKDINGLRAWAVVSVVLYHFGVPGFNGGFVGVDVFFVISGFLMTGIIVKGLESEIGFSISSFYIARARRIIPALIALCAVLVSIGWYLLPAGEYSTLSINTIAALTFTSNIMFWRETGYFFEDSKYNWLLHTWSLSAEWQFYLILPIVLSIIWKLKSSRRAIFLSCAAGLLFSLFLCVYLTPIKQAASFYMLPTRAWEMLLGGIFFFLDPRVLTVNTKRLLELLGFSLISASILMFDQSSSWPGWRALVPSAGAALVILSSMQNSRLSCTPIFQLTGNLSYSIYLWHWPVIVLIRYLELQSEPAVIVFGLLMSFLLGFISHTTIERFLTKKITNKENKNVAIILSTATLLVAAPALLIWLNKGIQNRIDPYVDSVFHESENKNPRFSECFADGAKPVPQCRYGREKQLGAIVIGDSHSASIMRAVEKALPSKDLYVLDWSLSECPTIEGIHNDKIEGYRCGDFVSWAVKEQENLDRNAPIIIMNRLSLYLVGPTETGLEAEIKKPSYYISKKAETRTEAFNKELTDGIVGTACRLSKTRQVFMVRPVPEMHVLVPKSMGKALLLGRDPEVMLPVDEYTQRQKLARKAQDKAAEQCGVKILDPTPYFCDETSCKGSKGGLPIYYDDDHLSEHGASYLVPMFAEALQSSR